MIAGDLFYYAARYPRVWNVWICKRKQTITAQVSNLLVSCFNCFCGDLFCSCSVIARLEKKDPLNLTFSELNSFGVMLQKVIKHYVRTFPIPFYVILFPCSEFYFVALAIKIFHAFYLQNNLLAR
jgi:hypothetical protein